MRSQASEWAAGFSPEISAFRLLKEFPIWKATSSRRQRRVEEETGGVIDRGTVEEDDTVTWEAPERLVVETGRRRTGDPLRRAAGGERTSGRLRGEG